MVERGDGRVEVVLAARRGRGRPRVEVDVEAAAALVRQGLGLRKVAAAMGVTVGTLRRRLGEAGDCAATRPR